jgi:hypothetical protein
MLQRFATGAALLCATLVSGLAHAGEPFKLVEGTDVSLQFAEKLSSATATEGQRFNLVLEDDLRVNGIVVVPHGAKAVGTVMNSHKRGFMGKAGELNIQINYLLVGEQRIPLRASSGREGDSKVGATVALTVLFGPLGLLKRGKNVEIMPGTVIAAFVDQTTVVQVEPAASADALSSE